MECIDSTSRKTNNLQFTLSIEKRNRTIEVKQRIPTKARSNLIHITDGVSKNIHKLVIMDINYEHTLRVKQNQRTDYPTKTDRKSTNCRRAKSKT